MEAIYARRRSPQHKMIKLGLLAVIFGLVFTFFANIDVSASDHAFAASTDSKTNGLFSSYFESSSTWSLRSLQSSESSCSSPGSKGTRAEICAYVAANCTDDSGGGYIDYLNLFYCSDWLGDSRPLGFVSLVFWLLTIFLMLGVISNDFFVPALTSVAYKLNIPAEIAGLTLLAFGNEVANVASYFAAVSTNTFNLAIGDVFGGGFFVTSVVLASVCFFGKDIRVDGYSFVRDVLFLLVAIVANFIFVWTGGYYIYESVALIVFYIIYVLWASIRDLMRQRKARLKKKAAEAAAGAPVDFPTYRSHSSFFHHTSLAETVAKVDEDIGATVPGGTIRALASRRNLNVGNLSPRHFDDSVYDTKRQKGSLLGLIGLFNKSDGAEKPATEPTVKISDNVQVVELEAQTSSDPVDLATSSNDAAANSDTANAEASTTTPTGTMSSSELRSAFANASRRAGLSGNMIGRAIAAVDAVAAVEDIIAPPLTGTTAEDNAVERDDMIIPNVHVYQDNVTEELAETVLHGAYIWTFANWRERFGEMTLLEKLWYIFTYVLSIPLWLTIPTTRWNRAATLSSFVLGWPIIFGAVGQEKVSVNGFPIVLICAAGGLIVAFIAFFFTKSMEPPSRPIYLAFLLWSFVMCIAWIYLIANELVNVLQAFGRILSIPDVLLGATVLTWGNAISDAVADTVLAAKGEARIAMGAIFGGPMFSTFGANKILPRPTLLFSL